MNAHVSTAKDNNDIIDISIAPSKRRKIRIDGDDRKIISIDPSDTGILIRVSDAIPKLEKLDDEARALFAKQDEGESENKSEEEKTKEIREYAKSFKRINDEMCAQIDYVFNASVSEAVLKDGGTMYDLIDGYMQYEIVFDALKGLYEQKTAQEMAAIKRRVDAHTKKYNK